MTTTPTFDFDAVPEQVKRLAVGLLLVGGTHFMASPHRYVARTHGRLVRAEI